jgi:Domain of Unknown Function with PDB structure (DUF3857)
MTITTKLAACVLYLATFPSALLSQGATQPAGQSAFPKEASVFELLHTHVRFEANGTGSRELTGRIRVQSEAATHELGLLRFSYASTFESLTIDYVRVRKPDGTLVVTPASDVQEVDSEVSRQAPMWIPAKPLRDKSALVVPSGSAARLVKTPKSPPGVNAEEFHMDASLDSNGTLEGKSRVDSHGDSEFNPAFGIQGYFRKPVD